MIVLFLPVVTGAENFDIFPCEMVREGAAASIIFLAIQGTSVKVLIISVIFLLVQGTTAQVLIISIICLVVQGTSAQVLIVTDSEREKCVDPGENGAILDAGGGGGPGPPGGGKNGQLASDSGGG